MRLEHHLATFNCVPARSDPWDTAEPAGLPVQVRLDEVRAASRAAVKTGFKAGVTVTAKASNTAVKFVARAAAHVNTMAAAKAQVTPRTTPPVPVLDQAPQDVTYPTREDLGVDNDPLFPDTVPDFMSMGTATPEPALVEGVENTPVTSL